jgi:hypothetical protein
MPADVVVTLFHRLGIVLAHTFIGHDACTLASLG